MIGAKALPALRQTATYFTAGPLWLIPDYLHVKQLLEELTITENEELENN